MTARNTVAPMAASLGGLVEDLAAAQRWLADNAEALAEAGAVLPGLSAPYKGSGDEAPELVIRLLCSQLHTLGAVTRIMVRGAGRPGLAKELGESGSAAVVRRFGRVSIAAWIAREKVCVPLAGPQFGWDCSAFLTTPLLARQPDTEEAG